VGKSKYNVGDVVTVTGKITRDDQDDLPLKIECESGTHFYIKDVDVSSAVSKQPEELKIGDYVTSTDYPDWGAGKIVEIGIGSWPYRAKYSNGEVRWNGRAKLTKVEAPVYQFKVGDYVTSKMFSGDGIGRIRKEKPSNEYWIEFEDTYHTCHVSDLTPATVPDFNEGVYVKSSTYPDLGVGKISFTDGTFDGYNVMFDKATHWHSFKEMEIVPEPVAHKFAVGDKVMHSVKGLEWGVGTVYGIRDQKFLGFEYVTLSGSMIDEPGPIYDVQYDGKAFSSVERFLIKAKGI
jgi:hypothetical protein